MVLQSVGLELRIGFLMTSDVWEVKKQDTPK